MAKTGTTDKAQPKPKPAPKPTKGAGTVYRDFASI